MNNLLVTYHFFPVGQGLFFSGRLRYSTASSASTKATFRWVYDCGSTSKKRVSTSIDALKASNDMRLDLLAISHFDQDHIGNVVELLNKIGTKTVMLPWLPLWQRLVIGFGQGLEPDDPDMVFYIDPIEYLSAASPNSFDEVLFVMPSGGEGPPYPPEFELEPRIDPERREGGPVLGETDSQDQTGFFGKHQHRKLRVLRSGKNLTFQDLWEFIPYNDADTKPADLNAFAQKAKELATKLLGPKVGRVAALKELKKLYVQEYRTAKNVNDASLMLYGGAMRRRAGNWILGTKLIGESYLNQLVTWPLYRAVRESRASILLTGDGTLASAAK